MELMAETELLDILAPEIARGLKGEPENEEAALRRRRLWAYLAAMDRLTERRNVPPTNALLLSDNAAETDVLLELAERTGRHFLYFQEMPSQHWFPGDGTGIASGGSSGREARPS